MKILRENILEPIQKSNNHQNVSSSNHHEQQMETQHTNLLSNENNDGLPDNVKAASGSVFSTRYDRVSGVNSGQNVPENCFFTFVFMCTRNSQYTIME